MSPCGMMKSRIVITLWSNANQLAQKWRPRMNRAFVITAVLLLSTFPAFSQPRRRRRGA